MECTRNMGNVIIRKCHYENIKAMWNSHVENVCMKLVYFITLLEIHHLNHVHGTDKYTGFCDLPVLFVTCF